MAAMQEKTNPRRPARVNELDLLRFLAAISVIFFHLAYRGYAKDSMTDMAYPWLAPVAKYLYLGVHLFFIISGFVILMTAERASLPSFIRSRAKRLYPAFWACCTITAIVCALANDPKYPVTVIQYLTNMTMLSGLTKTPYIDGAYWSLLVEMRFYFLIAIIISIKQIKRIEYFLYVWLAITAFLQIRPIWSIGFLLISDYSCYFIAGAICYIIWSKGLTSARLLLFIGTWALAAIKSFTEAQLIQQNYHEPMSSLVVFSTISFCFAAIFAISIQKTGTLNNYRWSILGALTYPLYLLHQNIGYIAFNKFHKTLGPHTTFWGVIFLMIATSLLVNILIEKKLARNFLN